ncbi:DUF4189 domain-containing protein [Nocardia sp. NPDC057440]|uniref:DUF4189 domain-containing protein n=1 Tax=Nocardia sp. NPDC057440 TaxID=3346134 RepID=UPI003671BC73
MAVSGKAALGLVVSSATAFVALGAGTAGAAGDLYGSLAISITSRGAVVGSGVDYGSYEEADRRALSECGASMCKVIVHFVNACGAVAVRDGHYTWAFGNSRLEAERAAVGQLGPDPSPLLVALGSAAPSRAAIVTSECTANAR